MPYEITKGVQEKPMKAVCYGPEGVGKSTFASMWPGAVFIDVEGGTSHYDVARYPQPANWQMFLDEIASAAKDPNVGTIVVDTADAAETLCTAYICNEKGWKGVEDAGYGKGYTYLAEEFAKMLSALDNCVDHGKHALVLAHAQIKKFEQPDEMGAYDRWELKLQKKCAPLVKEWADLLLFANFKSDVMKGEDGKYRTTGGKQRRMYASHTAAYDAKNRLGLADELPFDFDAIKDSLPKIGAKLPPSAKTVAEPKEEQEPQIMRLHWEEVTPPEITQLNELMSAYQVNSAQLMHAVGQRANNPYTDDTPIAEYDIEFIRQVIIPNFEAIADGIHSEYPSDGIPF